MALVGSPGYVMFLLCFCLLVQAWDWGLFQVIQPYHWPFVGPRGCYGMRGGASAASTRLLTLSHAGVTKTNPPLFLKYGTETTMYR